MSKDLEKEYLEDLDHYDESMGIHSTSYQKCKERLIRLAKIDSANPSEALYELNRIDCNITYLLSDCDINEEVRMSFDSIRDNKSCEVIKQTLLKAQEPKKYLTWEDLDFKEEEQTMKVLLNGEEYKLSYFTDGITEYVDLLAGNGKYQMGRYVDCYPTDVKFFNDLHLEDKSE